MEETVVEPIIEPVPDHELIRRIISGDQRAGHELYHRYKNRLYGFIFTSVKNRAAADEIFGETWLRFSESLRHEIDWAEYSQITSFLFTIARNIMIDKSRSPRNKPVIEFDDTTFKPKTSRDKIAKDIELCLMELNEEQRKAIVLRFYDKLTRKEIAIEMNIHYQKACNLLVCGIENLGKLLNKESE